MKQESSVLKHHGGKYFRTTIPRDLALNVLGLRTDVDNQRLEWKLVKGKVQVGKK